MRAINRGPFASNNAGTAQENKAVSQGAISHLTPIRSMKAARRCFHVEEVLQRENTIQRTLVTAITDEVLTYTNPTSSTGAGVSHTELPEEVEMNS
jgi:hypothetical protein